MGIIMNHYKFFLFFRGSSIIQEDVFTLKKRVFFFPASLGCGPFPVTVARKGLGWDSLLKMG